MFSYLNETRRFGSGILCGIVCTVTFNPLEYLKVRWQVQGAKDGDTIRIFVARILREEGSFHIFFIEFKTQSFKKMF